MIVDTITRKCKGNDCKKGRDNINGATVQYQKSIRNELKTLGIK